MPGSDELNHVNAFQIGGSWVKMVTEGAERTADPPIFTYYAWLGVSRFVVLATACFCKTLVILLLQIRPVPRAIQNNSPSHVPFSTTSLNSGRLLFAPALVYVI